jgi:hypothetical protein
MDFLMNLTTSHPSHSEESESKQYPWILIGGFIFFTGICILVRAAKVLQFGFPLGALIVSLGLYRKHTIYYVGFCWWLWFLTAYVARLSDYQSQTFDTTRLMMIAPYLATLVTLPNLLVKLPKVFNDKDATPFLITFMGISYGTCIGLFNHGLFNVIKTSLDSLVPVLFGFFLYQNWRNYPAYKKNTYQVFCAGILVMGIYGVFQYISAPGPDSFWVTKMIEMGKNSFGQPEPLALRTFSTMHSPGPYAVFLMSGLLLSFSDKNSLQLPSLIVGYLNFMLTLVRSAWGGWLVGLICLFSVAKPKFQARVLITICVLALCVVPLTAMEPFSQSINSRVESLTNLESDNSGQVRRESYAELTNQALTSWIGQGFGSGGSADSAILDSLFSMGWAGTIYYISGLFLLIMKLFRSSYGRSDPFINTTRAILMGMLLQLFLGNLLLAPGGIILWGFLGLGISGCRYYEHQQIEKSSHTSPYIS